MAKALYPLLLLLLFLIATEVALSIVFAIKDRNVVVEPVIDMPYTYYQFKDQRRTDANGFRTNRPQEKPANTYRIVLTGGSVARSGPHGKLISRYLELKLLQKLGIDKNIEVINAGVSGYVVQQELILIQMVIQHYQPDMIIGLDGYNDALTLMLNPDWEDGFPLKPHNWQDFKVIAENQRQQKAASRFRYTFRNIQRALDYLTRPSNKTPRAEDPARHITDYIKAVDTYFQVVTDIKDFCAAKGITYLHFVQPVNEPKVKERFETHQANVILTTLDLMHQRCETGGCISLKELFDEHPEYYRDDVHVNEQGNNAFATAMLQPVVDAMQPATLPQQAEPEQQRGLQ